MSLPPQVVWEVYCPDEVPTQEDPLLFYDKTVAEEERARLEKEDEDEYTWLIREVKVK